MSSGLHSAHNYHAWTHAWVAPYLDGRILDVGSGTANHLVHFADREVVSIDISKEAVDELAERYRERKSWRFEHGDITDCAVVDRLGRASFDTVISENVFEHIEDDDAAFRNAAALLKPGGRLVLALPAHQVLFGSMDRLAGHYRRYSRALAADKLRRAGLRPEVLRYVNIVGAIGWFVNNRLVRHSDLSSAPINAQISIFDKWLVPVLRRLEGDRSLPFGQSLICVGRNDG